MNEEMGIVLILSFVADSLCPGTFPFPSFLPAIGHHYWTKATSMWGWIPLVESQMWLGTTGVSS